MFCNFVQKVLAKNSDNLVLKMKYTGEPYVRAHMAVNYYNEAGNLIKTSYTETTYLQKDETASMLFELPHNSSFERVPYNAFTISVETYEEKEYQSATDKLIIGTPSEVTVNRDGDYIAVYCNIPIENTGTSEIRSGDMTVYFWKGTTLLWATRVYLNGIVGNETTNKKVWFSDDWILSTSVTDIPDGVTVDYNYATVSSQQ